MLLGKSIALINPTLDDLIHVKEIWKDEKTMDDVGGIYFLSNEKYIKWYNHMFIDRKNENEYYLIFKKDTKDCIGEISFHNFDIITKKAMFNIKIKYDFRKKGFGIESMDLILNHYFNTWHGEIMEDSIWEKNKNGLEILKKYGFEEIKEDEEDIWVELHKKNWNEAKTYKVY